MNASTLIRRVFGVGVAILLSSVAFAQRHTAVLETDNRMVVPNTVTITNGTEYLTLTPTNWVDSETPASEFKLGASAPTWGDFTDANLQVLRFSKAAVNLVHGSIQLNHGYKTGSTVSPHIHVWFPTAAADPTTSTNVWRWTYSFGTPTGTWPTSTTLYVTNSGAVTLNEHRVLEFPDISGSGMNVSAIMVVSIARVGTDDYDVYDDDIALISADLHYQCNSIGSTGKASK